GTPLERGVVDTLRQRLAARQAERDETLDRLIEPLRLEGANIVDHAPARPAEKTRAPRNPREERHERGLERPRQDDRAVVALVGQPSPERPTHSERELAVTRRELDAAPHLGHSLEERQRPSRRDDVDHGARRARAEQLVQRLREDHVADPRRADDEELLAHAHDPRASASRHAGTPASTPTKGAS